MADSSNKPGTVYLVGAGPGHPGLITRWGYDLLQQCDAVAYDALIPMELISGLPERVEKHYVGKRAGKHSLPQPQINELLAALANRGLNVVRLKGGDPFVFGRIGEEAAYLSATGIPVVMIPGVTAASAAAAMSGFSLTSRQESSWIFIATGHPAENSSTPVPWDQVAGLPGGTLVVYMGITRLDRIVEQLLDSGMAPETPAVVVQAASTGLQRSVHASLRNISGECRRQNLKPPALVIIGESVRCHLNNPDAKERALAGRKVLLTGPSRNTGPLCAALREAGAEPLPYPATVCRRFDDAEGWKRFLAVIQRGGFCLFQCESVVHRFFEEFMLRGQDVRTLAGFRMIALGKDTEAALMSHGIRADSILMNLESGPLSECLSRLIPTAGLPLIWLHGNPPAPIPEDGIREQCAEVIPLAVEMESTVDRDSRWKEGLPDDPPDFIVFTGTSEVKGFAELMGVDAATDLTGRSCVVAMGKSVSDMLHQCGFPCAVRLNTSRAADLVEALAKHLKEHAGNECGSMPAGT
jgi:uroporphyrinogen III methyltransferase/synthase